MYVKHLSNRIQVSRLFQLSHFSDCLPLDLFNKLVFPEDVSDAQQHHCSYDECACHNSDIFVNASSELVLSPGLFESLLALVSQHILCLSISHDFANDAFSSFRKGKLRMSDISEFLRGILPTVHEHNDVSSWMSAEIVCHVYHL